MYQSAIDCQMMADVYEECSGVVHTIPDPKSSWHVITARHPDLGPIMMVEDQWSTITLLSQNPLRARDPNYQLDEAA